jgi:hypothetical protein
MINTVASSSTNLSSAQTLRTQNVERKRNDQAITADQSAEQMDEIVAAFESASEKISSFITADIRIRLLDESVTDIKSALERAAILRRESVILNEEIDRVIDARNMALASQGKPPLNPYEERLLANRIVSVTKQRNLFLDNFQRNMQKSGFDQLA